MGVISIGGIPWSPVIPRPCIKPAFRCAGASARARTRSRTRTWRIGLSVGRCGFQRPHGSRRGLDAGLFVHVLFFSGMRIALTDAPDPQRAHQATSARLEALATAMIAARCLCSLGTHFFMVYLRCRSAALLWLR